MTQLCSVNIKTVTVNLLNLALYQNRMWDLLKESKLFLSREVIM